MTVIENFVPRGTAHRINNKDQCTAVLRSLSDKRGLVRSAGEGQPARLSAWDHAAVHRESGGLRARSLKIAESARCSGHSSAHDYIITIPSGRRRLGYSSKIQERWKCEPFRRSFDYDCAVATVGSICELHSGAGLENAASGYKGRRACTGGAKEYYRTRKSAAFIHRFDLIRDLAPCRRAALKQNPAVGFDDDVLHRAGIVYHPAGIDGQDRSWID